MSRIPKRFSLKGQEWSVEYKWNLRDDNGDKMDGLCVVSKRLILIDRSIPREEKWPVFLHEWVHAVIFESHISGLDGDAGDLLEEIICDSLETALNDSFNMRWKRKKR